MFRQARDELVFQKALKLLDSNNDTGALELMDRLAHRGFADNEFITEYARLLLRTHGRLRALVYLANGDAPVAVREAAFGRVHGMMMHHDRGLGVLRTEPRHGIDFSPDSLLPRALIGDVASAPQSLIPDDISSLLLLYEKPHLTSDPEMRWRVCFAVGALLSGEAAWVVSEDRGTDILEEDTGFSLAATVAGKEVIADYVTSRGLTQRELAKEALTAAVDALPLISPQAAAADISARWVVVARVFRRLIQIAAQDGSIDGCLGAVSAAQSYLWPEPGPSAPGASSPAQRLLMTSEESLRRGLGQDATLVQYCHYEVVEDVLVTIWTSPAKSGVIQATLPMGAMRRVIAIGRQWHDPPGTHPALSPDEDLRAAVSHAFFHRDVPAEGYASEDEEALLRGWFDDVTESPTRLVVVPWGYLSNVPFHLLPSVRHAIDAGRVKGLSVWPSLRFGDRFVDAADRSQDAHISCLMLHYDDTGETDPTAELSVLQGQYDQVEYLAGRGATIEALGEALASVNVAHIAAHGLSAGDSDGVIIKLSDGPLIARDIARLRLTCDLVVLNCCSSGVSADPALIAGVPGAENLARAFLDAGVPRVVATLWPVPDEAATAFAAAFHPAWRTRAAATGTDEILVRARATLSAEFTDMFEWGSYMLFGDWR